MTTLAALRNRLHRLKRRRWLWRVATAYSALLVAVLAVAAVSMTLDWLLDMSLLQRAVSAVLGLSAIGWAFYRYTIPWLGHRESELDLALMLERQEHLDSDLVAALQFESPAAPMWGSVELEQAVIDRAVVLEPQLPMEKAVPRGPLRSRLLAAGAFLAFWIVVALIAPQYVTTFISRLALSNQPYPTRTRITAIRIYDCDVNPLAPRQYPVKVPAGSSVPFEVTCSGVKPIRGEARLVAWPRGTRTSIELAAVSDAPGVYRGQIDRLLEAAECRFVVGDARTQAVQLLVVSRPVADVQLEIKPPSYAGGGTRAGRLPVGLRQVSVLEGSQVIVHLASDKPLHEAALAVNGHRYLLHRNKDDDKTGREAWLLDNSESPLTAVLEPLQFAITVADQDELQLEQPIQGAIRIQPDMAPRIAAASVTPYVLPTARPTISYRALDDFGLGRIVIQRQITHADGTTTEDEMELYRYVPGQPLKRDVEELYPLELGGLKLIKGDVVKATLRATDYRGPRDGQAGVSEPLLFHVTDQQGILAMIMESDRKSAEQLKAMIQRQLGIGGKK